jgi:hypothetical protein
VADTYGLFHWLLLSPENYSAIEGSHILVHPLTLSLSDSWVFTMSSRVGGTWFSIAHPWICTALNLRSLVISHSMS